MAVNNSITNRNSLPNKAIEYKSGDEIVKLSPSIIKNYLVHGNGNVTEQEIAMFLNLCRFQHLNPFLREAYLVKYGNEDATVVVGKEAITKRAMRNKAYGGQQAGIVILHSESGELEYRAGALLLEGEKLVGGWAKVYVKGYEVPIEAVVSLEEYIGRKKDGTVNAQWAKKPATMIRKVALVQALREAFPEDLGSLYAAEEVGVDINEAAMTPIEVDQDASDGYEPDPIPDYEPDNIPDYQPDVAELDNF